MKISKESFDILIILFLGLVPLLWLRPGHIIAKGDYFPTWFDPKRTLNNDLSLWSSHNIGSATTMASFMLVETLWYFFRSLGLAIGLVEILFQVFLFMGAGLSMYHLSKTVYPELTISATISGIFYMFNFFVLRSRLNVGFAWSYAFLPLLMALLFKVMKTAQQETKIANKNIIYFAIISTITFSIVSANPANVIIILLVLSITFLYRLISQRKEIRLLLIKTTKLIAICIPLNLWWAIPMLNYYLWAPSSTFNPEISVTAWRWTQIRASFLNLFWLNGGWDWRPEYVPYIDSYSNPILLALTFIPFILAAAALLFKTNKFRFNAYLMLAILGFVFLAKGLHEPLGQLNLLLYTYIPEMAMFREPTSKFTMALMPFIALLVGFSVHHIANLKIGNRGSTNLTKKLVVAFFAIMFILGAYPLVTDPIETKTTQLPYSSYVKIPDFWYEATDWLNKQLGDYKVLVTPPDDFYAMPYTWGYYGTEEFLARFIQKPILLTYYQPYRINPNTTVTTGYLHSTIKFNRTAEFKAFLDLLNIKYILQRNDLQHNFTGRDIIAPDEMRAFLTQQLYIHLIQKFGQLDIYEYDEAKPYVYVLDPTTLKQTTVKIENTTTLKRSWNFTSSLDVQEWQDATPSSQWQAMCTVTQENSTLKEELWNSTWGWKKLNSPILSGRYGDIYRIQADIKGQNASEVHIKIAEFDENNNVLNEGYAAYVNTGTFNWTHVAFNYEPTDRTTRFVQIQIWSGHLTVKPFPNTLWIDNITIKGHTTTLNTTGLDLIFQNTTQNRPATILSYTKINPTRITATINATQPFILAVSEALDQSWTAYTDGKQIKPTPLYLGLAGFYINQTGQLEISIEYEPQKWFYSGSIISTTVFLACLTYLTHRWTKNKAIWKRIKASLKHRRQARVSRHIQSTRGDLTFYRIKTRSE